MEVLFYALFVLVLLTLSVFLIVKIKSELKKSKFFDEIRSYTKEGINVMSTMQKYCMNVLYHDDTEV